jgi:hypothetical protein
MHAHLPHAGIAISVQSVSSPSMIIHVTIESCFNGIWDGVCGPWLPVVWL